MIMIMIHGKEGTSHTWVAMCGRRLHADRLELPSFPPFVVVFAPLLFLCSEQSDHQAPNRHSIASSSRLDARYITPNWVPRASITPFITPGTTQHAMAVYRHRAWGAAMYIRGADRMVFDHPHDPDDQQYEESERSSLVIVQ